MINLLFVFLTGILLLAFTGWLLSVLIFKHKQFTPHHVLTGLFFLVPLYAIVLTGGQSIFTVLVLGVLLGKFLFKDRCVDVLTAVKDYQVKNCKSDWLIFSVFAFIYFFGQYYLWNHAPEGFVPYPDKDIAYYGRLAGYLNISGTENAVYSPFKPNGNSLYHYGDIWLSALLSCCDVVNPTKAYLQLQIPLLLSLASFYTYKLIGLWLGYKNVLIAAAIAVLVPFYTAYSFLYPNTGKLAMDVYGATIWMMPKLLIIYLIVLLSFMAFVRKHYLAMNAGIWLLLFYYTAVSPGFILAMVLMNFWLYKKQELKLSEFIKFLAMFVVSGLLLVAFYVVFKDNLSPLNKAVALSKYTGYIMSGAYFKTAFNSFAKVVLQMLITNGVLILAWLLLWYKKDQTLTNLRQPLMGLVALIVCGSFTYAVFHFIPDSVQFWSNLYLVTITLLNVTILYVLSQGPLKAFAAVYMASHLVLHHPVIESELVSEEIYARSETAFKQEARPYVAVALSAENYKTVFNKNTEIYPPFTFMSLINAKYYCTNISTYLIPFSENAMLAQIESAAISNSPFEVFVRELKNKNSFVDYPTAQTQFLDAHQIKYLACDVAPEQIVNAELASQFTLVFTHKGISLYKRD